MVQNRVSKARGRPKAYDRPTALRSMRGIFWDQGFAATSLDDLGRATAMNRPSLYNAFGDKAEAFKAVLDDYVDDIRQLYIPAFVVKAPLRVSLTRVYETALTLYSVHDSPGRGCFMIGAALTDSLRDPDVASRILAAFHEMDRGFHRRLSIAQAQGELPPDADLDALTMIASATHSSLSVRMRAGESEDDLRRFFNHAITLICGKEQA